MEGPSEITEFDYLNDLTIHKVFNNMPVDLEEGHLALIGSYYQIEEYHLEALKF